MAVEIYSESDIAEAGHARVMILGPPKRSGKTVLVGTTAPRPLLFLNCDGKSAQTPAKRYGGVFDVIDIDSVESLEEACAVAVDEATKGNYRSIALDTLTILVNVILAPHYRHKFRHEKDVGFSTYRETKLTAVRALKRLINASAHLFVTVHGRGGEINVEGSLREDVPGLVTDIVELSYDAARDPKRLLKVNSRYCDDDMTCEADLTVLLRELGYEVK